MLTARPAEARGGARLVTDVGLAGHGADDDACRLHADVLVLARRQIARAIGYRPERSAARTARGGMPANPRAPCSAMEVALAAMRDGFARRWRRRTPSLA